MTEELEKQIEAYKKELEAKAQSLREEMALSQRITKLEQDVKKIKLKLEIM